MDVKQIYEQKLCSAEEAVSIVKSGDWIDYGWCSGHPRVLDEALAARHEELHDVKVRGGVCLWKPAIFDVPNPAEHFIWNSWHMSGVERKHIATGACFYSPLRYSELPKYYRNHILENDVLMFQVGEMDEHGYFNFGPNPSHLAAAIEKSNKIIVEVNKNFPKCYGGFEECIHVSQVDMIVEGRNDPIAELISPNASDIDFQVAKFIVEEIPNGACIQLGIGGMPNAVGKMIAGSDLKDLGVHTEMYVDAFVEMTENGRVTGLKKNIDKGRQVFAFAAGSKKLYDFIDRNPKVMAAPVNYTNDIRTLASIDNFMSINNAVEFDLFGQINAESSGTAHISGAGGQLDFVLGAYLSKGGKSFICCSSTFKTRDGEVKSRIVPTLRAGSIVTDTRANTQILVTEFGRVEIKGMTTWQRTEAIIGIAHPDFRDQLIKDAGDRKSVV